MHAWIINDKSAIVGSWLHAWLAQTMKKQTNETIDWIAIKCITYYHWTLFVKTFYDLALIIEFTTIMYVLMKQLHQSEMLTCCQCANHCVYTYSCQSLVDYRNIKITSMYLYHRRRNVAAHVAEYLWTLFVKTFSDFAFIIEFTTIMYVFMKQLHQSEMLTRWECANPSLCVYAHMYTQGHVRTLFMSEFGGL